jgi:YesN/AraC family two-component response regulator
MAPSKTTILLVDDSLFMLLTLKDMLDGSEFKVVGTATNGAEGLEKYKELKPEVVLLDIVLPDGSGSQVISKILEIDPKASIIMVSSLGTQEKVIECLTKGAKHFITKPFEQEGLLRVLRDFKHIGKQSPPKHAVAQSLTGINLGMKFFGQYLLERGAVTREQLLKAVEYQKNVNTAIEEICFKKGLLDKKQVERIFSIQKNNLDTNFNDIVIQENFMTKEQLESVLKEQKETRVYIGESFVKIGAITDEQLEQYLAEYKEEQEKDEWTIGRKLGDVKNQVLVKNFISFTMKMFDKIIKEVVKLKACLSSVDTFTLRDYTIEQKTTGDFKGAFIINLPEDVCLKVVSAMFGRQVKQVGNIEIDALKEFLNIINGNCFAKLSNAGINIEPSPPEFYNNKTEKKYSLPKKAEISFASLISTIGDFDLIIVKYK